MIRFPWTTATAPGLLLEITTGCNVHCRGCYKLKEPGVRSLEEIERDLLTGMRLRRAQTVSIAGAEPTLHPQLPEIVAMVRRHGLRTALLTNAMLLDDDVLLARLKTAGLDLVLAHIDEGQQRPDLPPNATLDDVNQLRLHLTRRIAAHGIDAGLCATIYPDTLQNVSSLVRLMLESEHIGFLFASHYVDVATVALGDGHRWPPTTDNSQVVEMLKRSFGIEPFAEADPARPFHWISYFIPVIYGNGDGRGQVVALRSGVLDSLLLSLPRWLSGRNLFYTPSAGAMTLCQVLLNRLAQADLHASARVLSAALRGDRLSAKRMIFDNGLRLTPEGKLDCLEFCPNSTVRNGTLVPICLTDFVDKMKGPCQ